MKNQAAGPAQGLTVLTGFDQLTTDLLARVLTRRGYAVCLDESETSDVAPALIVIEVDATTMHRLDEVRQDWPGVPLIAVTPGLTASARQASRAVDAVGLISHTGGLETFVKAVEVARSGGRLPPVMEPDSHRLSDLTQRETEVLRLLAEGLNNNDIGVALQISPHTARTHVQNVMAKLGVRNRLAATAVARDAGLLRRRAP